MNRHEQEWHDEQLDRGRTPPRELDYPDDAECNCDDPNQVQCDLHGPRE